MAPERILFHPVSSDDAGNQPAAIIEINKGELRSKASFRGDPELAY